MGDGEHQVPASSYTYYYYTEDAASNQLPLVDNSGNIITDANVTYSIYTPIVMSPALASTQLGPGMSFELYVDTGTGPALAYTSATIDFTSYNWTQVVNFISNEIAANTSYVTNAVKIAGVDYIKLADCTVVEAYIQITGPGIYASTSDIPQQPPSNTSRFGVSDAFVYQLPSGDDFLYGSRGLDGNTQEGSIQITDIAAGTTTEVFHPIDIPINQMTLVDQPPPAVGYKMNHLSPDTNTDPYYCLTTAIVDNSGGTWNDGYVYVSDDLQGLGISVYDQSEALVDYIDLKAVYAINGVIRYIHAHPTLGHLIILVEETTTKIDVYKLEHTGTTLWSLTPQGPILAANEFTLGSITTQGQYTVASTTPNSITVTGVPGWVNNQWSNYRIYTSALPPGFNQAVLYNFPTVPNISNNTTTLFIDPTAVPTFDASLLAPGDSIYMLGESDTFFNVYDGAGIWANDAYNDWDFTFEANGVSPQLNGKKYYIAGTNASSPPNNVPSLRIASNTTIGGYYNTASTDNSTVSSLLPGVPYKLYKNKCGALYYSTFHNFFYWSAGNGTVVVLDQDGVLQTQFQLQDSTGTDLTDGAFQFVEDPIGGTVYAVMRSANLAINANVSSILTSKDIYRISQFGVPIAAINGAARWNEDISGRIAYEPVGRKLYFTSATSRRIIEWATLTNTWNSKTIPSVYKKSASLETLGGVVYIPGSGSKFVVMNRLANAATPTIQTQYLFTNLFVYDYATNTIDSVLIGADTYSYTGAESGWNLKNLGEMFGEYNGYKDYCYGGMSINIYNGKIYFKQYQEERYYVCTPQVETGIAQIWAIGENPNTGGQISTYRLIRIFNIQSDGTVVPSVRTIYTYLLPRSLKRGPRYIKWDANTAHVIGVTNETAEIILIDPDNLTGFYGGPNLTGTLLSIPLTSKLSMYTNDVAITNKIEDPATFVINDATGRVHLFGKQPGGQVYNYQVYSSADLISTSATPTLTLQGNTGTPNNPGLYNTGGGDKGHNYPTVFNPTTNTIWQMGNLLRNTVPGDLETDRIINVYSATSMVLLQTINLTALGAVTDGATVTNGTTDLYHNHFYHPNLDIMVYYGKTNDKLLFINPTTYTILYNGPLFDIVNLNRSPSLGAQNFGWMLPYNLGIFVDRNDNATTDEFWTFVEASYTQYDGVIHDYYSVDVDDSVSGIQSIIIHDSAFTPTLNAPYTFGHYKIQSAAPFPGFDVAYWNSINGTYPTIFLIVNDVLELTMLDPTRQLIKVENITQGWTYDVTVPGDVNKTTLPTFNTKNSINFFAVKADNINLFTNDLLELTFANPVYPNCPFINQIQVDIT